MTSICILDAGCPYAIGIDDEGRHENEAGFARVPFRREHCETSSLVAVVGTGGNEDGPLPVG